MAASEAALARRNVRFPEWVIDCPCHVSTVVHVDEASTAPRWPSKWRPRYCPNCGTKLGRGRLPVKVKEPLPVPRARRGTIQA